MTRTDWYPANVKPAREGVYERMIGQGYIVYAMWTGGHWQVGHMHLDRASAQTARSVYKRLPWRGVTGDGK